MKVKIDETLVRYSCLLSQFFKIVNHINPQSKGYLFLKMLSIRIFY